MPAENAVGAPSVRRDKCNPRASHMRAEDLLERAPRIDMDDVRSRIAEERRAG